MKQRKCDNPKYAVICNLENSQPVNDSWPFYFNFSVDLIDAEGSATLVSVDKANAINTLTGGLFAIETVYVV